MSKKPAKHTPNQRDRKDQPNEKRRGFSRPHPKEDRRRSVKPWAQRAGKSQAKRHGTPTSLKPKYCIFPDLAPDEYESLKKSIAQQGQQVPIVVDKDGNIIDGKHRDRACEELGIDCQRFIQTFGSEAEKWETVLSLNAKRRHLNREQKRDLIAAYLKANPEVNDNWLAETIGGVSKNTVKDVRENLEATCLIDKFTTLRGRDGKKRPAKYARIIVTTPKEQEIAERAILNLTPKRSGEIFTNPDRPMPGRLPSRQGAPE